MCLALPGRIEELFGSDPLERSASVSFGGVTRRISLAFTPEAGLGDFVLVHVGVAIAVLDEEEAASSFAAFRELEALEESEPEAGS
jgi:hydrogenase expression/formation protein HypC